MRFPRWRKMTWTFLVVNALFLVWIIAGVSDRASKDCAPNDDLCINASDAGTAIGVGLIIFLWFFVFIVLSLVWLMTRPRSRTCPVCGEDVKKGLTTCRNCGHDFAAAVKPAPPALAVAPAPERLEGGGTQ
jgi:uncharacterized membrane protein YtjA (UPF0391 family)